MNKLTLGTALNLKGEIAEDFVYELSTKSFLTDWCYKSPKLPDGKELCDLLVVYDDTAIIWQIKDLKLGEDGKFKQAEVEKNIRQVFGARRALFELKAQVQLENPRRGLETFKPDAIKNVYLISALLGLEQDYYNLLEIEGKGLVHTFTREFVDIVLNELDTINDFTEYLRKKEEFILFNIVNKHAIQVASEKELLAYYLMNERIFEKLKEPDFAFVTEGCWEDLQKRPEYRAKKEEDKSSYFWDYLINRAHTCGGDYEIVARELARSTRLERRTLSKRFIEAHINASNESGDKTYRRVFEMPGTTYCFVFLDDAEPRTRRKQLLENVCFVARGMFRENKKVIGIATDMKIRPVNSYDFCFLEIPEWTEKDQEAKELMQRETGILTELSYKKITEEEYPKINKEQATYDSKLPSVR
ncbi:MAG: hypothetical protein Sv326_0674 [Candidatus Fermentimicrarchaeum limneticum]|uniref:Uncharacterized protein n=1 Tax=Fermentimicrarchaeum limneticum TaxID=2795018 RepID=A0A7D5XJQ8_FERL1|nr:MAG: hypothetical protein Sv326_0674 [Candidatus Fermentimicrarchaeum limneticum]